MKILYINYIDSGTLQSGSSVRPTRILQAFKESGQEIVTLTGNQMGKERKEKVRELLKQIKTNKPDICYIESPVHPIYRHCDRNLIQQLKKNGVPTGFFLRDFYAKFRKDFPRRKNSIFNYLKDLYWDYLQRKTYKVLKNCSIVYLPSEEAKSLFDFNDMRQLPPAGENRLPQKKDYTHTCIYVGGWGGHYDNHFLMEAFSKLHEEDSSYRLILVCREAEWKAFDDPYKNAEWLEVHHTSGDGLIPLYKKASVGLMIPRLDYRYSHFAVSVKTFEYMSYGLPIVTINSTAMGKIVRREEIGFAVNHSVKEFNEAIKAVTGSQEKYSYYADNVKNALLNRHLWKHRVEQVVKDLSGYRVISGNCK